MKRIMNMSKLSYYLNQRENYTTNVRCVIIEAKSCLYCVINTGGQLSILTPSEDRVICELNTMDSNCQINDKLRRLGII